MGRKSNDRSAERGTKHRRLICLLFGPLPRLPFWQQSAVGAGRWDERNQTTSRAQAQRLGGKVDPTATAAVDQPTTTAGNGPLASNKLTFIACHPPPFAALCSPAPPAAKRSSPPVTSQATKAMSVSPAAAKWPKYKQNSPAVLTGGDIPFVADKTLSVDGIRVFKLFRKRK
jgi:hypothetical protein